MKDLADLLRAIADILWPILVFTLFLIFRGDIVTLLQRLKRWKLFGQELELREHLDKLKLSAAQLEKNFPEQVIQSPDTSPKDEKGRQDEDLASKVLSLAASSPKAALMLLSSEIDGELRRFIASTGHHARLKQLTAREIIDYCEQAGMIPRHLMGSVNILREVRNQIVHGHEAKPDDVLRAIDSGLTILKALQGVARETNIVYHPGVDLFADSECKQKLEDVKGVILETTSPGGAVKTFRIFPTTHNHYKKGKQVAWEWNDAKRWGQCWFRDPDSGEIKSAWGSSMEFVGRHLEDV